MWIDVKDKLPNKYENVLVNIYDGISSQVLIAKRVSGAWEVADTDFAFTIFDESETTDNDYDLQEPDEWGIVTAWQPMPKGYEDK